MRTYFTSPEGPEYASFLKCAGELQTGIEAIDARQLVNFLSLGAYYADQTVLRPVRKHTTHQPFLLHPEGGFIKETERAKISLNPEVAAHPEQALIRFFE